MHCDTWKKIQTDKLTKYIYVDFLTVLNMYICMYIVNGYSIISYCDH